jgi:chemotaxis response regulator CheB
VKIKIISTKIPNKMAAVMHNSNINKNESEKIIAIGASTGGVEAISKILVKLPESIPGIVIVQHMPPKFSTLFATRMNSLCKIFVKEAYDDYVNINNRDICFEDFLYGLTSNDVKVYFNIPNRSNNILKIKTKVS